MLFYIEKGHFSDPFRPLSDTYFDTLIRRIAALFMPQLVFDLSNIDLLVLKSRAEIL
jgi:hypothetical protein